MKILLTGSSGFVGRNCLTTLLLNASEVRAQYRNNLPRLSPEVINDLPRCELVQADLEAHWTGSQARPWVEALKQFRKCQPVARPDLVKSLQLPGSLMETAERLVSGCDQVVHVAARTIDWGTESTFAAVNSAPTLALLLAAQKKGIKRFVYVSSIAIMGFGPHDGSDETGPYYDAPHPYQSSKKGFGMSCGCDEFRENANSDCPTRQYLGPRGHNDVLSDS